jgi:peptide/nickel transport system substrate-binding protein
MEGKEMIKIRLVKSLRLLIIVVLAGSFLFSCGKPERSAEVTEGVNKLTERVDKLSQRVDQLTEHVSGLNQKLAGLIEKVAVPVRGGSLVICQPAEPPGLDPTANTAAAIDRVVWSNVFETLTKVNDQGQLLPGLAKWWDVSPDGKIYTFYLRKGVKFHNGESFDASVAKWNLERAKAEGTVNPHPEFFRVIANIEAPDDATLQVTLKDVDALFLIHLAMGDASILPRKAYVKAKSHPIGTGPFKFVEWIRGDRVELTRFHGYWNPDLPYLDKVTIRFISDPNAQTAALKAGDIDVIGWIGSPETALELAKDKRFKVLAGASTSEVILSTNNKAKPFDNLKVRQAMAHAIDRGMILDLAMSGYGTPIGSHWSPVTPYYVDLVNTYPYDPEKAKNLLAEAGYPNGLDAVLKVPGKYAYSVRAGEVIADQFAKVGIRLKMENIEWGQWISRIYKNKEYQLTIIGHAEGWDIGIYAKDGYYFQYDSKEFRQSYANALKAPSETEKAKWFGRCQEIIAKDAVNGYLFSAPSLPVMKAEVMGWWQNYPTIALDCTQVWWKK